MSHAGINSIDGRDGMLQSVEIEDSENSGIPILREERACCSRVHSNKLIFKGLEYSYTIIKA